MPRIEIVQTMGDFLKKFLRETELQDAENWVCFVKRGIPEKEWEAFLKLAPADGSIGSIADRIVCNAPGVISRLSTDEQGRMFENAKSFIAALCEAADAIGVSLELGHYLEAFRRVA